MVVVVVAECKLASREETGGGLCQRRDAQKSLGVLVWVIMKLRLDDRHGLCFTVYTKCLREGVSILLLASVKSGLHFD